MASTETAPVCEEVDNDQLVARLLQARVEIIFGEFPQVCVVPGAAAAVACSSCPHDSLAGAAGLEAACSCCGQPAMRACSGSNRSPPHLQGRQRMMSRF